MLVVVACRKPAQRADSGPGANGDRQGGVSLVIQVSDLPTFIAAGLFASCSSSHASKFSSWRVRG
jgi:hypothetical protein